MEVQRGFTFLFSECMEAEKAPTQIYRGVKISLGALFSQIAFKNLFYSKHFGTQWGVGMSDHYLKEFPFSDKQPSRFLWGMEAPIGIAYKWELSNKLELGLECRCVIGCTFGSDKKSA